MTDLSEYPHCCTTDSPPAQGLNHHPDCPRSPGYFDRPRLNGDPPACRSCVAEFGVSCQPPPTPTPGPWSISGDRLSVRVHILGANGIVVASNVRPEDAQHIIDAVQGKPPAATKEGDR